MANQEHLDLLKQGVIAWNQWRQEHAGVQPDLYGADISTVHIELEVLAHLGPSDVPGINLRQIDLHGANLREAILSGADLIEADLRKADLYRADLRRADLYRANLSGAILYEANFRAAELSRADLSNTDLSGANLSRADLSKADLSGANLTGADLNGANLSGANLNGANLTSCRIYAISAWNVQLEKTIQASLIITPSQETTITVDNLEVAQFIYLLLNNKKIRDVIDTITSKVVLILGRFTPERKIVLNALRDELRKRNYSPVLFDFEKPGSRDLTETISTLAHMARFVVADLTDAKSIPQELNEIVPDLPSVPVQPLLHASDKEYGMFEHFMRYSWVLKTYRYRDVDDVLQSIQEHIINPAEQKVKELAQQK